MEGKGQFSRVVLSFPFTWILGLKLSFQGLPVEPLSQKPLGSLMALGLIHPISLFGSWWSDWLEAGEGIQGL